VPLAWKPAVFGCLVAEVQDVDLPAGRRVKSLPQTSDMVYDVAWNPERDALALAGDYGAVRIYHLAAPSEATSSRWCPSAPA
jgi:hypothetical protein